MAVTKLLFFCFLYLTEAYLSNGLVSISITRHHKGDIFTFQGEKCFKDFCVGLSSGTARATENDECECKCEQHLPVLRDDLNICVDDIQECALLPFVSGTTVKKIPYVFLPLKGQIVYPSAEIVVSDSSSPVCVVSGGQFLGRSGWLNLRNNSGIEPPFRLFRDEGRTYLQWFGETSMRMAMEGRIILVHLMCKDASTTEEPKIFTPCIAFRVAGNPSVREVLFATDLQLTEGIHGGLSLREYIAIGLCSLFLGIVYVASVFLYLHWRKQKQKNIKKKKVDNAQLTLGEEGIIKSNPLLQASRLINVCAEENPGYTADSNSCCSDPDQISDLLCLDDETMLVRKNVQTSALIHPCDAEYGETILNQDPNNIERLPEENVSIVETLEAKEVHPETIKAIASINGRRKLYFNPSYFDPELLRAPPPAALEFLVKIREVIAIAKHKMSNKKFSPSLLGIPEEEDIGGSRTENNNLRAEPPLSDEKLLNNNLEKTLAINNTKIENLNSSNYQLGDEFTSPSDTKQRIIQKWLEDIPILMNKEIESRKYQGNVKKIKDTESDKISSNSNFWSNNKPADKNCKTQFISNESVLPVKHDKKRPSTKSRPPPVPPQKSSSENQNTERQISLEDVKINNKSNAQSTYSSFIHKNVTNSTSFTSNPASSTSGQNQENEILNEKNSNTTPSNTTKNLMNAVIQELNGYKKNEKFNHLNNITSMVERKNEIIGMDQSKNEKQETTSQDDKTINLPMGDNPTSHDFENNKIYMKKCMNKLGEPEARENISKCLPRGNQDDHEYEIILLNPQLTSTDDANKSKSANELKLPEICLKSERKEGYSLVSEVYVNDGYCSEEFPQSSYSNSSVEGDKISYEVMNEKAVRLTIQLKDSTKKEREIVNESDNFEPDTLDRKQRKSKLVQKIGATSDECERYSNQKFHNINKEPNNSENSEQFTDSLERPTILLKTNGSFKRNSLERNVNELFRNLNWARMDNFGSLREIYEAKSKNHKRRTETTSLIDPVNSDTECISTLSWCEERRNKLLHRGIILHIDDGFGKRHKGRHVNRSGCVKNNCFENASSRPPKTMVSARSRTPSPISLKPATNRRIQERIGIHSPMRSCSPLLLPPRSSSPHHFQSRSTTSSPVSVDGHIRSARSTSSPLPPNNNTVVRLYSQNDCSQIHTLMPIFNSSAAQPTSFPSIPDVPSAPPRPPKTFVSSSPPLPPRNLKPPVLPRNSKGRRQKSDSIKLASRPLPPIPTERRDSHSPSASYKDFETISTASGASMDSLNSSEYEPFYTMPYEDEGAGGKEESKDFQRNGCNSCPNDEIATSPSSAFNRSISVLDEGNDRNHHKNTNVQTVEKKALRRVNRSVPHRLDDSGYLSTDSSESYCPQMILPAHIPGIPERAESREEQTSETEESICDGASESGAESTATDSFFYGDFKNQNSKNSDKTNGSQVYTYPIRLSDVEVNSDTERHCMPIMVRP